MQESKSEQRKETFVKDLFKTKDCFEMENCHAILPYISYCALPRLTTDSRSQE